MCGPRPTPLVLSARQQAILEQLTRRHTSSQALVRRAQIILAAANGANNSQIAQRFTLHRETVRIWRARWLSETARLDATEAASPDTTALTSLVLELLADCPRPGAPDTFTAEQVVEIVALACTPPPDSQRPTTHWTPRELADEAVKRKLVSSISPRTVGRFLKASAAQTASEPLLAEHQGAGSGHLCLAD
jgi:putative transposase